ncbi:MAG: hypothetical protein WA118_12635 [Carboxydocellales bacterium]
MPDIIGFEVGEALEVLAKCGVTVVKEASTKPPGAVTCSGEARVLRSKVRGPNEIELLITYRDFTIPRKEVE